MGEEKQTTQQTQTQQATATPEETRLNQLLLERSEATQGQQIGVQQQGLGLIQQLLGGQDLPGYLQKLPGGLDEGTITDIAQKSVQDILPSFQAGGILDSGAAARLATGAASDVRRGAAEYNIGNLLNLLNLAVGGQAQIQQPLLGQQQLLGQQLAGLRPVTGTSTGITTGANPFMRSFQQASGQTLGTGFGIGNIFGTEAVGNIIF